MNHAERKSGLRMISALLVVCLLLSFSACGLGKAESTAQPSAAGAGAAEQSPTVSNVTPETDSEHQSYVKRLVDDVGTSSIAVWNGRLYAAQNGSLFTLEGDSLTHIYSGEGDYIQAFDVCGEGIWCLSKKYTDTGDVCLLEQVAFDGSLVSSAELTEIPGYDPEWQSPQDIKVHEGLVYIRFTYAVAVFSQSEGAFSDTYGTEDMTVFGVKKNSEGVAVFTGADNRFFLKYINSDVEIELPSDIVDIFDAQQENCFYYITSKGLFRLLPDLSSEAVVIWSESAIANTWLMDAAPLGDGFALLDEWELFLLQPGEAQQKRVIIMATTAHINTISRYITEFNQQSDSVYVEIEDLYSEYGSRDNAVTALNTKLIAGEGPDLIYSPGGTLGTYGTRGYLCDLYDFIDADADLNREDFVGLSAMETGGKLFSVTPSFLVHTYVGLTSVFGERSGWTFDEYFEMETGRSPDRPMVANVTKESFLEHSVRSYTPTAIDWSKGTCDFDNEDFIEILQAASKVQEADLSLELEYVSETPEIWLASDINVLLGLSLNSINEFVSMEQTIDQELTFIGWPSPDGHNTSAITTIDNVGISTLSENQDAAWSFLKYLISDPEVQGKSTGFPVLRSVIEDEIDNMLHPYAGKEIVVNEDGSFYADGVLYTEFLYDPTPMITEKQAQKIWTLLDSLTTNTASDSTVQSIVQEEAAAFLAGDKTAAEIARLIQSRVQLYVGEQAR